MDISQIFTGILLLAQDPPIEPINSTIDTLCVAEHWNLATSLFKAVVVHGSLSFLTGIIYRL
jgi:hypothetical protein